ncbi:MAG: hypothetical protein ACLP5V_10755 [Candidatus Bathyarchaeia archaeon]
MSEAVGNADRRAMRRELNKEALFIAGFTDAQINGLGDLSQISSDRMHEILISKILYLEVSRDKHKIVIIGGKKRKRRSKIRSRKP